jgi:hypothetical protein
MVTSLLDSVKSNGYWLSSVLSLSSRYPEQLEWPKTIISDFSSITADEINGLARKYLESSRAATARVTPRRLSEKSNFLSDRGKLEKNQARPKAIVQTEKEPKNPRATSN